MNKDFSLRAAHQDTVDHRMRVALAAGIAILMAAIVAVALAITSAGPAHAGSGGLGTSSSGGTGSGGGGNSSKYERLWDRTTKREKRWARSTSQCESGGHARIHGGGGSYHGAFQFTLSTWRSAPKSPGGDPHTDPWKTQAVVAIYLKRRAGSSPWPNCG
jgi:hypothetical protein